MTYFHAFMLLCVLTMLACIGEHPDHTAAPYPDAGPVECKEVKVKCDWADPVAQIGWNCFWVDLCPQDEDGGV